MSIDSFRNNAAPARRGRRDLLARGGSLLTASLLPAGAALAQSKPKFPKVVNWAQIGEGKAEPATVIRYNVAGFDLSRELGGAKIEFRPGFPASLPVLEAITAGAIDFSFATSTALIYGVGAKVPLVPLVSYPLPADEVDILVHPDSPIRTVQDLKGKRVADHRGTTSTYSLVRYLEAAGLTLKDIQYVNLVSADAEAAFANRKVDAWISWQPQIELARRRYNARTLPAVVTYDYAFFIAREGFVKDHPEAAAILARTVRDAQRYIEAKPDEAVAKFAELGGFGSDKAERDVYYDLVKASRLSYSGAGQLNLIDAKTAEDVQKLADSFHELRIYPERVKIREWLQQPRFESIRRVVAAELARK